MGAYKTVCPYCKKSCNFECEGEYICVTCGECGKHFGYDTIANCVETQWIIKCPKCGKAVYLPDRNMGVRKVVCGTCNEPFRCNSDTGEVLNDAYVEGDSIIVTCSKCNAKNKVPQGRGNLLITCARCKDKFYLLGDPNYGKSKQDDYKNNDSRTYSQSAAEQKKGNQKAADEGFFSGVKNYFRKKNENAEAETEMVKNSNMSKVICNVIRNYVESERKNFVNGTPHDFVQINVSQTACNIIFAKYGKDKNGCNYVTDDVEFDVVKREFSHLVDDCYTKLSSKQARKALQEMLYNEYLLKLGWLVRCDADRLGVLQSQL